ncbi:MAG: hypothetical protein K0S55_1028 [Clostridia bacterium]|nr:hypothetical protein [Clostridia bacterium]
MQLSVYLIKHVTAPFGFIMPTGALFNNFCH